MELRKTTAGPVEGLMVDLWMDGDLTDEVITDVRREGSDDPFLSVIDSPTHIRVEANGVFELTPSQLAYVCGLLYGVAESHSEAAGTR